MDLKQDTVLSAKDYDAETVKDGHNGRKLVVTLDTTGNTAVTEAIPPETTMPLVVNKDQTAKPTDVTAANQGSDPATKVRFKAADGAAIKIYKAEDANKADLIDGKPVKGTGDNEGYFIATLNAKLAEGTWIEITAQETGKKESSPEQARVIRDKNSNWEGGKTINLSASVISPIREKDEKVTVEAPKAVDKIQTIVVEDSSGNSVILVKDTASKTWMVQGSNPAVKVTEKDGKIEIPVEGKLPLKDRDLIKVTFKDGEDPANEAFDRRAVQKASQKPIVDKVYTGDENVKIADPTRADETATTIKVKVNTNDSLTIEKQADGAWKITEKPSIKVEVEDGKIVVPLDPTAKKGDKIEVTTINDSKVESAPAKVEFEDKVLTTKPVIKEATKDTNFVTGTAEKNADIVVKVTKKDGTSSEFRGKADKAVDNAKDKVLDPKASEDEKNNAINDAQDKIDKIPGSTDPTASDHNPIKKDLQDKLDLIKKIKKGEDRLKQDDIKEKPANDVKALQDAIDEGKKVIDSTDNKAKTDTTTIINDAIVQINKQSIKVSAVSLVVGLETLDINTSVPGATVVIKIDGKVIDTITTSSFGIHSKGLRVALQEYQRVTLEASKSGYNDGKYSETIF